MMLKGIFMMRHFIFGNFKLALCKHGRLLKNAVFFAIWDGIIWDLFCVCISPVHNLIKEFGVKYTNYYSEQRLVVSSHRPFKVYVFSTHSSSTDWVITMISGSKKGENMVFSVSLPSLRKWMWLSSWWFKDMKEVERVLSYKNGQTDEQVKWVK